MSIHLALLLGYLVVQVALGLWISRKVTTTGDFFVAGRSLGPGLLFSTLVAANIGAGSTIGATGLGYRDGLSAWWWVGSAGIGSLVLAFTVGPRIRRIAAEHDLQTVGDFLERRYDRRVRAIVAALLWLGTLAILAGQIVAMGLVLNAVWAFPSGSDASSARGGDGLLHGGRPAHVGRGQRVQLTVELVVFVALLPLALNAVGGWSAVAAAVPQDPE